VFFGIAATLGLSAPAEAQFRSPRTAALGGAGRANPILNDALFLNPSFASFLPVYSWSANFKSLGEAQGRAYTVSVLDGRSEAFQAGIAYEVRDLFTAAHIGASHKIDEKTTLGVGAKLFFTKSEAELSKFREFSASMTHAPNSWLQLAAVADNLNRSPEMATLGMERELILGAKLRATDQITLYIDPHFKLGDSLRASATAITGSVGKVLQGYEAGAELMVFKDFYFRMGTFKNSQITELKTRANGLGYGIGWVSPRISFDYAVEHVLTPVDNLTHTAGTTLYF